MVNMSNVDDLLEPLRYNNLSDFELTDVRSIGGGVFAQTDTIEHLQLLDTIVKAYQSVHVPTYGQQIPNTPYAKSYNITSATSTKILEPAKGEVYRIDTLNVLSTESGTEFNLAMQYESDSGAVVLKLTDPVAITRLNTEIVVLSINDPIIVTYPQVLIVGTTSSGTVDTTTIIGYTKLQQ